MNGVKKKINTKELQQRMKQANKIKRQVCLTFGVRKKDIEKRTHKRENVLPRHVCFYIHWRLYNSSLRRIETDFGLNYNHSTVGEAIKTISSQIEVYPDLRNKVETILSSLTAA